MVSHVCVGLFFSARKIRCWTIDIKYNMRSMLMIFYVLQIKFDLKYGIFHIDDIINADEKQIVLDDERSRIALNFYPFFFKMLEQQRVDFYKICFPWDCQHILFLFIYCDRVAYRFFLSFYDSPTYFLFILQFYGFQYLSRQI